MRAISSSRFENLHVDPAEADVVARVPRIQHLVAGVDARRIAPDRGDDPGSARRGLGCRCRKDEAGARLRLVRHGLDDDELVERLERDVDAAGLLDHASNDTPNPPAPQLS